VTLINKNKISRLSFIFTSQGLVICNLAQTLDISVHSKSGLRYDWCYHFKPGSNQKTDFLRKRNKIFINMSGKDTVQNFVLMAGCRICGHVTASQRKLIVGSSFYLKQQVDHCCTFCLHAYIYLKQVIFLVV
jgi:hypothetical protein